MLCQIFLFDCAASFDCVQTLGKVQTTLVVRRAPRVRKYSHICAELSYRFYPYTLVRSGRKLREIYKDFEVLFAQLHTKSNIRTELLQECTRAIGFVTSAFTCAPKAAANWPLLRKDRDPATTRLP